MDGGGEGKKKSPAAGEEEEENIFLFVPNLIGYARIVLAIISFWFENERNRLDLLGCN